MIQQNNETADRVFTVGKRFEFNAAILLSDEPLLVVSGLDWIGFQIHYRQFSFFVKWKGPFPQQIDHPMVSNRLPSMSSVVWIVFKFAL